MAIKIDCAACGFDNDLGRVFCTQCGQKLDMRRTSISDLQSRRELDFGKTLGRILLRTFAVAIVIVLALAFWPMPRAAIVLDQTGAPQVVLKTRAVKKALVAQRSVSVEFTETELNGYLAVRAKARDLRALTVDLKPGVFELQAWMTWHAPFTNIAWLAKAGLPLSCGLTGSFEGGKLAVTKGRVGHLPLVGPTAGMAVSLFGSVLNDVAGEKEVVGALTQATINEGKVELRFGK